MENKRAKELIKKYLDGTCTAEEKAVIESWYLKEAMDRKSVEKGSVDFFEIEGELLVGLKKARRKKTKMVWYGAAAVAVVSIALFSYLAYFGFWAENKDARYQGEIMPGGNKAILTLSDGSRINLNDADYGVLATEAGVHIRKTEDGQLIYDLISDASVAGPLAYNTIETPKGGQYQVNLPDGTKVWLNAASSLKLPTVFNAEERAVEITGEVYFEVAKRNIPFRVRAGVQVIEVLGTRFNVEAYPEEPEIRTSLIEGSVRISALGQRVVLKPGEQTLFSQKKGTMEVVKARTEDEADWKEGYFNFNGESIEAIMNKIARWYDVDIEYHPDFVDQGYVGTVSRFERVDKVLKMLELTGTVHFEIKGRRIIVMP